MRYRDTEEVSLEESLLLPMLASPSFSDWRHNGGRRHLCCTFPLQVSTWKQSPSLLCQTLKTTITKAKRKDERALCSAITSLLTSHSLKATTTSDYFQRGEGRIFPRHPASHHGRKMLFLHTCKPKTLLTHCELHRAMTWCNTLTWPCL